jgi:hypothetical protein
MTQLSADTVAVLQNFATINPNFVFEFDKPLGTISPTKSIVAQYSVDSDVFPVEFSKYGIYDLNEFLTALALVGENANLDFSEKSVAIKGDDGSIEYFFSRRETLNVSVVSITMPAEDLKFQITQAQLAQLKKASSVFGHKKVRFSSAGSTVVARVCDPSNATAASFSLTIEGATSTDDVEFVLDIDNFKFVKGDYAVTYAKAGITLFDNPTANMKYWIAVER